MGGSQPCNANTVDRAVAGDMQVTSHCAVWGERERENSRLGTNIELTPGHQPAAMGKGQGAHVPARDLQTETGRAGKRMWRRLSPRGGRGAFTKGLLPPSERARTHRAFCVCVFCCVTAMCANRAVYQESARTLVHTGQESDFHAHRRWYISYHTYHKHHHQTSCNHGADKTLATFKLILKRSQSDLRSRSASERSQPPQERRAALAAGLSLIGA